MEISFKKILEFEKKGKKLGKSKKDTDIQTRERILLIKEILKRW